MFQCSLRHILRVCRNIYIMLNCFGVGKKILFQEKFVFNSEDYPLRLHILSNEYHQRYPQLGASLGLLCIRKLLDDIEKRSVMNGTPDYRVIDK